MRDVPVIRKLNLALLTVVLFAQACFSGSNPPPGSLSGCGRYSVSPVLLVHGSGLNASTWNKMIRQFRGLGYPAGYLLAVNLVPNDGDNILAAEEQISEGMEKLIRSAGQSHTDSGCTGPAPLKAAIVAHSMGAISSRWYATRMVPTKVRLFISLAGSNHGTDALCGLSGVGNEQMCPAYSNNEEVNRIQVVLNGIRGKPVDETPFGIGNDTNPQTRIPPISDKRILYLTVRIESDEWIVPANSAMLDGAGGFHLAGVADFPISETSDGNYVLRTSTSHDELPSDPDLIRFVFQVLSQFDE